MDCPLVNRKTTPTLSPALGVCAEPLIVPLFTPVELSDIPKDVAEPIVAWLTPLELSRQINTDARVTWLFAPVTFSLQVQVPLSHLIVDPIATKTENAATVVAPAAREGDEVVPGVAPADARQ
jgi:hypothetical protein